MSNGKAGSIGYCSGGRQSFLVACELPVDAAVDCYGAFVISTSPPELPFRMEPVIDRAPKISCPILGLFGAEDKNPSPDEVAQIDAELTRLGKEHEFHTFENAGHGFFAVDRPMYRVEAAVQGWRLILDFYGRHLAKERSMCSYVVEKTAVTGSAKAAGTWSPIRYRRRVGRPPLPCDLDHALMLDFINAGRPVSERVALELSVPSARELIACMQAALDAFVEGC